MILQCFEYNQHFVAMMNIINYARLSNKEGKFEKHHIVPKCWFKHNKLEIDNSKENLVNLTHEQHIKVHKLSIYCIKTDLMKQKMISAYNILEHKGSKLYMKTGRPNEETCKKISISQKGKPKQKVSIALKGRKLSEDHKNKIIKNLINNTGRHLSEETKRRISKSKLSEFGEKYIEHYGLYKSDNEKLYRKELYYFRKYGKFSWEIKEPSGK